jgi:uncharacterized cupredoxin-like copper-binding protein
VAQKTTDRPRDDQQIFWILIHINDVAARIGSIGRRSAAACRGRPPMPLLTERYIPMIRDHFISVASRTVGLLGLVAAIVGALSAPVRADTTVQVELWDKSDGSQGINLSTDEVKAGKVTFEITNTSKNKEHEFLIVKTDMTFDQFPMKASGTRVEEDKLEGMDELGDVETGETKSWTTELTPGRYVLFCNKEGHFPAGMRTTFMVTP